MATQTVEEIDHWQELMNESYVRFQKGGDLHKLGGDKFVRALDPVHKFAVMCGNLNYQVENGGFLQWIGNGYCLVINDLIEDLGKVSAYYYFVTIVPKVQ